MAFNFYGTFTTGQLERFVAFVNIQKVDLEARKAWLQDRQAGIGKFSATNDASGFPVSYAFAPINSYGAKLLQAYKILGGIPECDFLLNDRDNPVFLTRGQPIRNVEGDPISGGFSDVHTDGRIYRGNMRFDNILGERVEKLKNGFRSVIRKKRENIEYKIKAALDYSDQLENEVNLIDKLLGDARNSLQNLITTIEQASIDQSLFMPPKNDADKFGLKIGRPADDSATHDEAQRRENLRGSALQEEKNV